MMKAVQLIGFGVALMAFHPQSAAAEDGLVRADVSIYLEGALLERGGTVFVLPREVAAEAWASSPDLPNPARSDQRLDDRRPTGEGDRRLSVLASGQVSIVRFDYPVGGTYDFRFLPALDSGVAPEGLGSVLVEVGTTYDYHPETRAEVFVPQVQVITILGPDGDPARARALAIAIKLGHLEERYTCDHFESALVCDASDHAD